MVRIRLGHARPHMHLGRAVLGADGCVLAGAGTTLGPAVIRSLARLGVRSVEGVEDGEAAAWEEDKAPTRALAELEAPFPGEPAAPSRELLNPARARSIH